MANTNKNIFDITNNFFIIDSNNIDKIETRLYGFTFLNNSLIKNIEDLQDNEPQGDGAYVLIKKNHTKVTISQDFIGSYGLYLYKKGDYFAISNSFIYLLDYIKQTHKITFNWDFANYMIPSELCSASFSQTMINEIEILDRCAIINIDIETKQLDISYIDYKENTVELNSVEGMAILDNWYNKWTNLIYDLKKQNQDIQLDLSGGFDTRIILTLFLGSGINLNNIFIYSSHDDLHTHTEDYEISSAIGKHYGFSLNNNSMLNKDYINYSVDDSINISFYLKLCFHKQMYPKLKRLRKHLHCFGGSGGECIRSYWNMSEEEYIQKAINRCNASYSSLANKFQQSTKNIIKKAFEDIKNKFERFGRSLSEENLTRNLYRETRCRNHFGKDVIENLFGGVIKHTPLLDPDLHKLKLNDSLCLDNNLLMTVILDRYNPDLLSFKFDSNRIIEATTIKYAQDLNRRFPYISSQIKEIITSGCDTQQKTIKNHDDVNFYNTLKNYENAIKDIYYSDRVRTMFELIYGETVYNFFSKEISTKKFHPLQNAYTTIAITKVFQDALIYENLHSLSIAESLQSNIIETKSSFLEKDSLLKHPYLENYVALRLDIKNTGECNNDLEISKTSDTNIKKSKPAWLAKNGNGYTIESQKGSIEMTLRCINSGTLSIVFRGRDVRNLKNERIPFWIDLKQVNINGEIQLSNTKPIWHDSPFRISRKVENGEIIQISVQWEPHDERTAPIVEKNTNTNTGYN